MRTGNTYSTSMGWYARPSALSSETRKSTDKGAMGSLRQAGSKHRAASNRAKDMEQEYFILL